MDPLIWPLVLLFVAIALIFLEIFVPSGGILSLLAACAVIASLIVGFSEAFWVGTAVLVIAAVVIPVVIAMAIRWWPHTPIGRMVMIHRPSGSADVLPQTVGFRLRETMLGKRGVATSCLLPSGAVRIEGKRYDAISEGMPIDAGQAVVVADVRTQRIVVRPLTASEQAEQAEQEPTPDGSDDILSTPIDSLGIDPFDNPLA